MPTNEIARSTTLYVLVADENKGEFDYRALLPDTKVQWGFVEKPYVFEAALRLQPWDIIIVDQSMIEAIPGDLLAAADFAEEGHDILLLVEQDELLKMAKDGLLTLCGYVLKGKSLKPALARYLRRSLYHQTLKQERTHLEHEIARILNGWEQSIQDRTQKLRRHNEELRNVDEIKNAFLENISHELRTPMTLVRSYVELLMVCPPSKKSERLEFLKVIDAETKLLGRMIDDLLDLARLNAGSMAWKMGEVDVSALIPTVVSQVKALIEKQHVACEVEMFSEPPPVWGDGDRISQVLMNLIDNSLKQEVTRIKITSELITDTKGSEVREFILVTVQDDGPGIPKDMLERVFERFSRATVHANIRGVGLGLAICREILNHHKGRIWAEEVDVGARLCFTLPLAGHLDVISGQFAQPEE